MLFTFVRTDDTNKTIIPNPDNCFYSLFLVNYIYIYPEIY